MWIRSKNILPLHIWRRPSANRHWLIEMEMRRRLCNERCNAGSAGRCSDWCWVPCLTPTEIINFRSPLYFVTTKWSGFFTFSSQLICRFQISSYLNKKGNHLITEVRVHVIQILDNTLGPLETVFSKSASAVQCHDFVEVFQTFIAHLLTDIIFVMSVQLYFRLKIKPLKFWHKNWSNFCTCAMCSATSEQVVFGSSKCSTKYGSNAITFIANPVDTTQ